MSVIDDIQDMPGGIRNIISFSKKYGWTSVVTHAVGELPDRHGDPGRTVESFAIRLRGPRRIACQRDAAVAIYLRNFIPGASYTFHEAWTWIEEIGGLSDIPDKANVTALKAFISSE